MYKFDDNKKIVQEFKDCRKCLHLNVCKFHHNMSELANKDVMYRMNRYLETNDILLTFELHTTCMYYETTYRKFKSGNNINLECDPEIIEHIIYNNVKEIESTLLKEIKEENKIQIKNAAFFFFQPEIKTDINNDVYHLILKTTNKDIGHGTVLFNSDINISNILKDWCFGIL